MTDNKYHRGKIYKIISPFTDKIYIGSTCEKYLSNRLGKHKALHKKWIENDKNPKYHCSVSKILKYEDVSIILIEKVICQDKDELISHEQFYLEQFQDICVNIQRAKGIGKKDSDKEYYKKNKEIIAQKSKIFRQQNKETIDIRRKKYLENNREKENNRVKEYYIKNREKILIKTAEKIKCECGKEIQKSNVSNHKKSIYHKNFILKKEPSRYNN